VPAQHMFGLEHSIIMPWQLGYAISNFNPFFPEDIHQQTRQLSQKIILLTTPIHIQACINSGIRFENILQVISSTMPLSQEMASAGEDCFNAPITEIYGSTETGAMGFRRTSTEPMWHLYKGLTISEKNHQFLLHKPDGKHIEIHDQLQLYQNNQFSIIGRNSDLIKIAGKRMSLADLNFKLNSLDGVEEGIFVLPSNSEVNSTTRLKVFVVAPTLSEQQILTLLKPLIDPLFLPRTIVKIDSLPKNTLGKILLSELTERK